VTTGKLFLLLAWVVSLCFELPMSFIESYKPTSLILCVLTLAIWGLIYRFDELERQIAGRVPEPEPKPGLEPSEEL
jgi:hypothetical protein